MSVPVMHENRKVQITGKSSCMVSLPMRWVKEMGFVQGSAVTITIQPSNSLLITPKDVKNDKKNRDVARLQVKSETPDATVRKIICLYVQGYNLIQVKFEDANSQNSLNAAAVKDMIRNRVIGVEILADLPILTLQVLLGKSELSIQNTIKHMSVVSSETQRDALSALISFNRRSALEVNTRSEIERFNNYLNRQLLSSMNPDGSRHDEVSFTGTSFAEYFLLAKSICDSAASAKSIAELTMLLDRPLDGEATGDITRLGRFAGNLFDEALLAYFKKDLNAAEKLIENAKQFTPLEREFVVRNAGKSFGQSHVISSALNSLKQIVRESAIISELVLGLTVNQITSTSSTSPPWQTGDDMMVVATRARFREQF